MGDYLWLFRSGCNEDRISLIYTNNDCCMDDNRVYLIGLI